MKIPGSCFVYILASKNHGTLYIGVTNDLRARLELHRAGKGSEFVKKYGVTRLVYMERVCFAARGHPAREAAEGVASGLEDQIDRARKSRLGRSIASSLTFGVMGPGLRRGD
jgi:GIY-YIG catalytic domain